MTLPTYRIIPKIDIKNANVVKGFQMEGLRALGDPYSFCNAYYQDGADEIIINDLTASMIGRSNLFNLIKEITSSIFIPITVGGGIKTVNDISKLLKIGADKVFINTNAILNPNFILESANIFGSSTISISIETLKKNDQKYYCFYNNGREQSNLELNEWIKKIQKLGCGEIILSSITYDGSNKGYDEDLLNYLDFNSINVPLVINSGFKDHNSIIEVQKKNTDISGFCISSKLHYDFIEGCTAGITINQGGNTEFINSFVNLKKNKSKKFNTISSLKKILSDSQSPNFRLD